MAVIGVRGTRFALLLLYRRRWFRLGGRKHRLSNGLNAERNRERLGQRQCRRERGGDDDGRFHRSSASSRQSPRPALAPARGPAKALMDRSTKPHFEWLLPSGAAVADMTWYWRPHSLKRGAGTCCTGICRLLALLGPRGMSDLSPQSGPKRTLIIQIIVTNRDFMSTRPSSHSHCTATCITLDSGK